MNYFITGQGGIIKVLEIKANGASFFELLEEISVFKQSVIHELKVNIYSFLFTASFFCSAVKEFL